MPTRSTSLGVSKPAAVTTVTIFTVPAGQTYLVKDVVVFNEGGVADTVYVQLRDPLPVVAPLFQGLTLGANARAEWSGWAALNPGQSLTVYSALGTSHFWVSGTKLPGVA